ncbi:MAG TPA: hypothetical protein H9804_01720 [Candidatus Mucispirillum faecigallinarum]|uniref:Portal protein n=1 Tax=Candidatus Mucispirillum faecigallinarum TaxID=2838699 RepID=A0A9D2GTC3_9BACT|nr:hypothetical protein [Candidatus Mucispirillum faecigallinarum]
MNIKLEDKDILEIINTDKEQALSYYNQHLKPRFKKYYELYNGEQINTKKYRMPESSFISRDVLVTIRTLMPDINKLLFSSNPVEVTARSGEDEEKAAKMQALLNYQITAQNPYHTIFTRLITNALITGCAALKVLWIKEYGEKEVEEVVSYEQMQSLINEGFKVRYESVYENGIEKYKVKYKAAYISKNQPVFEVLPYNEFLFDAKALSLQEADYVIHRKLVNYDYLKRRQQEGIYKNIEKIKDSIFSYEDDDVLSKRAYDSYSDKNKARRLYMINEYWGRVDIDNDGLLEDVVITTCGNVILSIEENTFGMYPFFVFSPFLSMDSIAGRGLAELSENTQIVKTALIREILENTRRNNNRKIFYKVDDLLNPSQMVTNEQYVAVRDSADINNIFAPEPFEVISENSFTLVEYFDKENQKVTGVSDIKQGLKQSVESQTATEAVIKYESANSQVQAIVLNFAESLKETYRFIVYQNQRFMDNVQVVRLLNDVIEINPQDIKDIDFDLNISQSLSSGTADTRRRSLNNALAMMIEIGEPRSLTDSVRIRNLMAKILEESGLKDTENYLISAERLRQQVQNDETA